VNQIRTMYMYYILNAQLYLHTSSRWTFTNVTEVFVLTSFLIKARQGNANE